MTVINKDLAAAVASFHAAIGQEDPLTQSKRELDAEIIRFNSDMKEVLAQANLHEAVGRSGGCASFDTQQAAVVQNTISTRQVLSEGMAHVTRRVDLLNEAAANGALSQGDVDKLRQFVETLRHRASDYLGAMTRSGLTLRGLVQEAPMGGSGSAPRILNPVPRAPAQCTAFSGTAFSPLPDLPMLTGTPGSDSREALGQQWTQLSRLTTETRTGLEERVADMHARLAEVGDLVVQDSGRDFRAAFIQVEELILDASLRREALVKAFIDSGRQDLKLLNQAVSASREVLNLYQGAKTELVELASMAIDRAIRNAETPGLQDPVPVPQQLWVYQAGGVSPLLPRSPSLLQVQSGEQLTGYASFKSVPLQQAREQGLCKVYRITLGNITLPPGGFQPRPLPGNPLQPNLPNLVCVETY
jgi:hypothetical protein